jgi:hypothetical protein
MHQSTITEERPTMRRRTVIPGLLVGLLAAAALAASAAPARAATPQLPESWDCITVPGVTDQLHCARPGGLAELFSHEAEVMTVLVFDAEGEEFLGTETNVRADIFHQEERPCPRDSTSYQYTYLGGLGLDYWACHHFESDHL